jgi:hypothetical protein
MMNETVPFFGFPPITQTVLDGMLDEYYLANGWVIATSIPTPEKLHELGLEDVAARLSGLPRGEMVHEQNS